MTPETEIAKGFYISVGYGPLLDGDERLLRRDSGHCASAGQQALTATTSQCTSSPKAAAQGQLQATSGNTVVDLDEA